MAGGVGSRFWPMSIPERPKQFIDVLGTGKTMIQLTVERFKGIIEPENVWVVTSKRYKDIVMEQLPEVPESHILMEPCMRNTAPCIATQAGRFIPVIQMQTSCSLPLTILSSMSLIFRMSSMSHFASPKIMTSSSHSE